MTVLQRDAVFVLLLLYFADSIAAIQANFPFALYDIGRVECQGREKKTFKSMWKKMRERRTATEEIEDENVGDKVQCKAKNEEKRKINHYRWGSVVVRCLLFLLHFAHFL